MTKEISLFTVPYHLSRRDGGMAAGPDRYLEAGALSRLAQLGMEIEHTEVVWAEDARPEPEAVLAVNLALREAVRQTRVKGRFPLILSGGCSPAPGALAALDLAQTGIVWLDAHGDYNTPETTPSGYLGGMPLAVANGLCYPESWAKLTDQDPVSPARTALIGGRDLDAGEMANLTASGVLGGPWEQEARPTPETFSRISQALDNLARSVSNIYLHLDIDILDPSVAPGVNYPSPNGWTPAEVLDILAEIAERFRLAGAALTAYNPSRDVEGRTLASGLALLARLGELGTKNQ